MPRVPAPQRYEMPVLRQVRHGRDWTEETVPSLRRIGFQDGADWRRAARAKEDPEDHGLRSLRQESVTAGRGMAGAGMPNLKALMANGTGAEAGSYSFISQGFFFVL